MKPIVLSRLPLASVVLGLFVLTAHTLLCFPAATRRGYPPIHPFWETVALFVCYAAFLLFPFFDDRPRLLRLFRNVGVPLGCIVDGIALVNLRSAIPSLGHLVGYPGLIPSAWPGILVNAIFFAIVAYPMAFGFEKAGTKFWSMVREFADPGIGNRSFRFSLPALIVSVALVALAFGGVSHIRRVYDDWPRSQWTYSCRTNLRQIAVAMLNYEQDHGTLPPAFVTDKDGKPMHSWRVLLLPYLGRNDLYQAYDFDEPWNSARNKRLISRIPSVYRCRWDHRPPTGNTSYVVIQGSETLFPGGHGIQLTKVGDGISHTVLLVEMADSDIPWTCPSDLSFHDMEFRVNERSGAGIRTDHPNGFQWICFADGHHAVIHEGTRPETLKALVTANGGENVTEQDLH